MEPTPQKGDRVLVNKLSYDVHDVHRGDVVVFEIPTTRSARTGSRTSSSVSSRLPGDTNESRDGVVYINDRRVDEPYLPKGTRTGDPTNGNNPRSTDRWCPKAGCS